jgi:hypothetical protein
MKGSGSESEKSEYRISNIETNSNTEIQRLKTKDDLPATRGVITF